MKAAGASAEEVTAAEELRDIARVLSITAGTDINIRDAMTGILNIADRLDRRNQHESGYHSGRGGCRHPAGAFCGGLVPSALVKRTV
jgi:hypothetical protein